jgi:hypothetical protein
MNTTDICVPVCCGWRYKHRVQDGTSTKRKIILTSQQTSLHSSHQIGKSWRAGICQHSPISRSSFHRQNYYHRIRTYELAKLWKDNVTEYGIKKAQTFTVLDVTQRSKTFRDNLSVASSRVRHSTKIKPTCCPETSTNTNMHCVTSQKSEDLIYTTAEDWNHASKKDPLKRRYFHQTTRDYIPVDAYLYWVVRIHNPT